MENEIINIFRNNLEKMDSKIEILQNNLNSGTTKSINKLFKPQINFNVYLSSYKERNSFKN